jgi:hypothetical protein
MTELHYAAYCGDLNAMRKAIEAGMDVNSVDAYRGYTPVLWLADMAANSPERPEPRAVTRQGTRRSGCDKLIESLSATARAVSVNMGIWFP